MGPKKSFVVNGSIPIVTPEKPRLDLPGLVFPNIAMAGISPIFNRKYESSKIRGPAMPKAICDMHHEIQVGSIAHSANGP